MASLGLVRDPVVRDILRKLLRKDQQVQGGLSTQSVISQGQQVVTPIDSTGFVTDAELASTDASVAANVSAIAANTALINAAKPRTTILGSTGILPINTNQTLHVFPTVHAGTVQFQYPRAGSLRSLTYNMSGGTLTSGSATIDFELYAGAAGGTLLKEEIYSWTGTFGGGVYLTTKYASGVHTFSANDLMLMFIRFTGTFVGSINYMAMQAELEYDD